MYTYTPLQTLMQVIFLALCSLTGYTCIDALQYDNGGPFYWYGLAIVIIALSAQITLLISQIIHNNTHGY